ncbi:hypothetical protein [Streptomyces sp. NPDC127119]|uniref:hypothetical protein n=1 Tax=Streptomyces sp. NPDC127119 TaxID=3345370 RepID=UPI003644F93C
MGAALLESAFARWTLSAGPLVLRVTALPGPAGAGLPGAAGAGLSARAGVPGEPAFARWTLSAGPWVRVTGAAGPACVPGPVVDADAEAAADAGRTGPVGAGLVPGARWTLTAGPPVRVTGLPGLLCVPPAVELSDADADAGCTGPAGAGLPVRADVSVGPVAGARWTVAAGPSVRVAG